MANDFKPNIYPIMYWALAFGATAGVLLFLMTVASAYIGIVWFPVFLLGVLWGGYRNYKMQKARWYQQSGQTVPTQSPIQELKQAVTDIADASQELMNQESQELPETPQPDMPAPSQAESNPENPNLPR